MESTKGIRNFIIDISKSFYSRSELLKLIVTNSGVENVHSDTGYSSDVVSSASSESDRFGNISESADDDDYDDDFELSSRNEAMLGNDDDVWMSSDDEVPADDLLDIEGRDSENGSVGDECVYDPYVSNDDYIHNTGFSRHVKPKRSDGSTQKTSYTPSFRELVDVAGPAMYDPPPYKKRKTRIHKKLGSHCPKKSCPKVSISHAELEAHLKKMHSDEVYRCCGPLVNSRCKKLLGFTKKTVVAHFQTVHEYSERITFCNSCPAYFTNFNEAAAHRAVEAGKYLSKLRVAERDPNPDAFILDGDIPKFGDDMEDNDIVADDTSTGIYLCEYCWNRIYGGRDVYLEHLITRHSNNLHRCEICAQGKGIDKEKSWKISKTFLELTHKNAEHSKCSKSKSVVVQTSMRSKRGLRNLSAMDYLSMHEGGLQERKTSEIGSVDGSDGEAVAPSNKLLCSDTVCDLDTTLVHDQENIFTCRDRFTMVDHVRECHDPDGPDLDCQSLIQRCPVDDMCCQFRSSMAMVLLHTRAAHATISIACPSGCPVVDTDCNRMASHLRDEHKRELWFCARCDISVWFRDEDDYLSHRMRHVSPHGLWTCGICQKDGKKVDLRTRRKLRVHMNLCHGARYRRCPVPDCADGIPVIFKSLQFHSTLHHPSNLFFCNFAECKTKVYFLDKESYLAHGNRKHRKVLDLRKRPNTLEYRMYRCPIPQISMEIGDTAVCGAEFCSVGELFAHGLSEHGARMAVCPVPECKRAIFHECVQFLEHMSSVHDRHDFVFCSACGPNMRFASEEQLLIHSEFCRNLIFETAQSTPNIQNGSVVTGDDSLVNTDGPNSFESTPEFATIGHALDMFAVDCDMCGAPFPTQSDLNCHHNADHNEDIHRDLCCEYCSRSFKTDAYRLEHIKADHPAEITQEFPCPICKRLFYTRRAIVAHQLVIHPTSNQLPRCPVGDCDVACYDEGDLRSHVIKNHPDKKSCVICPFPLNHGSQEGRCPGIYTDAVAFRTHVDKIHSRRIHICAFCGPHLWFTNYEEYRNHRMTHRSSKYSTVPLNTVVIDLDQWIKPLEQAVKYLSSSAMMQKMFVCELCCLEFTGSLAFEDHSYNVHLKTLKKSDFICDFCPKYCGKDVSRIKHIEENHYQRFANAKCPGGVSSRNLMSSPVYSCADCGRIAFSVSKIKVHIKTAHPIRLPLPNCPEKSCQQICLSIADLENHSLAVHGRICVKCPEESCHRLIFQKVGFHSHLQRFHNRVLYLCPVCPITAWFESTLELEEHLRTKQHFCCPYNLHVYRADRRMCSTKVQIQCPAVLFSKQEFVEHGREAHAGVELFACLDCTFDASKGVPSGTGRNVIKGFANRRGYTYYYDVDRPNVTYLGLQAHYNQVHCKSLYKCNRCPLSESTWFTDTEGFDAHCQAFHPPRECPIEHCGGKLMHTEKLLAHVRDVHGLQIISCPQGKQCKNDNDETILFYKQSDLIDHLRTTHGISALTCPRCPDLATWFRSQSELDRHVARSHPAFRCVFPGCMEDSATAAQNFESFTDLISHAQTAHRTFCKKCKYGKCQEYFMDVASFRDHLVKRHQLCPSVCDSCSVDGQLVWYNQPKAYDRHRLMVHSDFVCPVGDCGCQFQCYAELAEHANLTHNVPPSHIWPCGEVLCKRVFFGIESLSIHLSHFHNVVIHPCYHCSTAWFQDKCDLTRHVRNVHNKDVLFLRSSGNLAGSSTSVLPKRNINNCDKFRSVVSVGTRQVLRHKNDLHAASVAALGNNGCHIAGANGHNYSSEIFVQGECIIANQDSGVPNSNSSVVHNLKCEIKTEVKTEPNELKTYIVNKYPNFNPNIRSSEVSVVMATHPHFISAPVDGEAESKEELKLDTPNEKRKTGRKPISDKFDSLIIKLTRGFAEFEHLPIEVDYCCELCAEPYDCLSDLEKHRYSEHLDVLLSDFRCEFCPEPSILQTDLERQRHVHDFHSIDYPSILPKLICQRCTKRFYTNKALLEHVLAAHAASLPLPSCPVAGCNHTYFERKDAVDHFSTVASNFQHFGKAKCVHPEIFYCDLFGCKSFFVGGTDDKKRHREEIHTQKLPVCKDCKPSLWFPRVSDLLEHRRSIHRE